MKNTDLTSASSDHQTSVINKKDTYQVVLPCEPANFQNFISSLLGKSQVLKGHKDGYFDVGFQEIINIYHLVDHRVQQQNDASLMNLSITVYYNNGTSITHNNLSDFEKYYPTEACHPVEVLITFIYLIKFQNNQAPEKQEIEVSFCTSQHSYREGAPRHYRKSGIFEYKITHTERTWATDIAGLLKNHSDTFVDKDSKLKQFLSENFDEVIAFSCSLFFIITMIFWCNHTFSLVDNVATKGTDINVTSFIKYATGSLTTMIVLAVALFSIKNFFEYNITIGRRSFIVLVDKDERYKKEKKVKERNEWAIYIFSWLMSVVASIIANHIFSSSFSF